jgi:hypothetical protein
MSDAAEITPVAETILFLPMPWRRIAADLDHRSASLNADKACADVAEVGPQTLDRILERSAEEPVQSAFAEESPGKSEQCRVVFGVGAGHRAVGLVANGPDQREQAAERADRAGYGAPPDRPSSRDLRVQMRKPVDARPQGVGRRVADRPDVAQHDRRSAHQAGFERGPERVIGIVAMRQLSEHVHLGVGEVSRMEPPAWRLEVAEAVPSRGDDHARRIGEHGADADVAAAIRLPCHPQSGPPRLLDLARSACGVR